MDILFLAVTLLVLLFLIVYACMVFTNAIEWLGKHYQLSEGAIGSVFAAVGTALPETIVPIVALVGAALAGGDVDPHQGEHIGIGAILGAPFLLSTLAMGITGLAVFYFASKGKRPVTMKLDKRLFNRDLRYFFLAYTLVFLAAFIAEPMVKWGIAIGLLVYYVVYVKRTLEIEEAIDDHEADLDPLMIQPKNENPSEAMILLQTLLGIGGIIVFAHLFVGQIGALSEAIHLNPLVLSLIVVPIATEMPEKFNSVVWIGRQKDNLALANITGAMVFQSCIPTAVGLAFTPWVLDAHAMLSVAICFASSIVMWLFAFRWGLQKTATVFVVGAIFYVLFLVLAFGVVEMPAEHAQPTPPQVTTTAPTE